MELKVKSIIAVIPTEFTGNDGKLVKYDKTRFMAEDDAAVYETGSKISVGDALTGEVTKEYQGIKTFKKAQKAFGGGGKSYDSPERQASIEFQSARKDAIAYVSAKMGLLVQFMEADKAKAFINKEFTGEHVMRVTDFFLGKLDTPEKTEAAIKETFDTVDVNADGDTQLEQAGL